MSPPRGPLLQCLRDREACGGWSRGVLQGGPAPRAARGDKPLGEMGRPALLLATRRVPVPRTPASGICAACCASPARCRQDRPLSVHPEVVSETSRKPSGARCLYFVAGTTVTSGFGLGPNELIDATTWLLFATTVQNAPMSGASTTSHDFLGAIGSPLQVSSTGVSTFPLKSVRVTETVRSLVHRFVTMQSRIWP